MGRGDWFRTSFPPWPTVYAAFRRGDLARAEEHYRLAAEIDGAAAAAWFGLYMVAERAGEVDSARVWLQRAQRVAPGATLLRPAGGDTAGSAP